MYRTSTNNLPDGGADKNAELIRLKKEYHQLMLRELQKKQQSMTAKTSQ